MANSLKWNGPQFLALLRAEIRRRISAACHEVMNHAKDLISIEGTGRRLRRIRKAGRLRKSKKLVYGANPSAPGEPPHTQRGRLRASVAVDVQDTLLGPAGRVGTNVKYGRALELGASGVRGGHSWTLLARPWLRRALKEKTAAIKAIMCRPWNP